jgi:phosphoribosylaminoimidazolecarboxamide formyltransferase / IMP cyclohydrolase
MKLKYGMNPYQKNACLVDIPQFRVINGNPSLINILDALNSWQLVKEIYQYNGSTAAASFKHVTPSGVALAADLSEREKQAYLIGAHREISPTASAYIRARGSDRLASFGDFIAINAKVDGPAAKIIRSEVSDGIIAPAFTADALEILRGKQSGNYVIFEIDFDYEPPLHESREVFGVKIIQDRNDVKITGERLTSSIVTENRTLPQNIVDDLCIGMITLKYTQSNSICLIKEGQVIGIGSGQQSRILCTELAVSKANRWFQKLLLDYTSLEFPAKSTRTEKDQIIDEARKEAHTEVDPEKMLREVSMCSDGYFPQIDNIELAAENGVKYIASPMGSIRDTQIIRTCNERHLVFCDTGIRLFHH